MSISQLLSYNLNFYFTMVQRKTSKIENVTYMAVSSVGHVTACGYILDHRKESFKLSTAVFSEWNDHSRIAARTCVDMVLKKI